MTQHEYWKGRRVLVTGHTGFVGCWLAQTLAAFGAEVTGFSLPAAEGALFDKVRPALDIRSVEGDLRDAEAVRCALRACEPEVIFHLAAFGFVKECFAEPSRAFDTNVGGTLNILEAARDCDSVRTLVAASSDKVYRNGDGENVRFVESDPLGGVDPYSASKTCEDILTQSFYDSYLKQKGLACVILRPSNILGGGDHLMSRLIPGMFYSLRRGEAPVLRNPDAVRPWQDVMDAVDAYLCAAERAAREKLSVYNVGPEEGSVWTVGEIAAFVSGLYGRACEAPGAASTCDVWEYAYLGLNAEKIGRELGWHPIEKLADTLRGIYDFYETDDGVNTASLCGRRIREYYAKRRAVNGALEQ